MTATFGAAVWHISTRPPQLVGDDVHVWRFVLDQPKQVCERLELLLCSDERSRAARFVYPHLRERWVTSRAFLRLLLAGYLEQPAATIEFRYPSSKKPELANDASGIQFNLSHSAGLALAAVCRGRPVGVDVESYRVDVDHAQLSERFFSPVESDALQALPPEQRKIAFFTCWTRKEAYIKALGLGLSVPLDSFDVSVTCDQPRLLAARHPGADSQAWQIANIHPGDRYCASLVVRNVIRNVWQGEWQPTSNLDLG